MGLPPGVHGIHLHAIGRYDPPAFGTAGAHLNPLNKKHGWLNPSGSHMGDLPNLSIDRNGRGSLSVMLAGSAARLLPLILDSDGAAVVIHADSDDYMTDPSGNSGARLACGVVDPITK